MSDFSQKKKKLLQIYTKIARLDYFFLDKMFCIKIESSFKKSNLPVRAINKIYDVQLVLEDN